MFRSSLHGVAAITAGMLADIKSVDLPRGGPRVAPRRFGDVTIIRHAGLPPKPLTSDAVTVSDFTMPYMPTTKGNGRPAESYRAARRNEARAGRRWLKGTAA